MKEDNPPYELISPRAHGDGLWLPYWLICLNDLTDTAKIVYARLVRFAGNKEYAFPSQQTIADELHLSLKSVQRYLLELRRYGLIWRKQVGLGKSNVYYFCNHPCRDEHVDGIPAVFRPDDERKRDNYDEIFDD